MIASSGGRVLRRRREDPPDAATSRKVPSRMLLKSAGAPRDGHEQQVDVAAIVEVGRHDRDGERRRPGQARLRPPRR